MSDLAEENANLQSRLEEAEETMQAIRSGEVDAVIVSGPQGEQVFTLKGEDHAYRALVEAMNEGAATISSNGFVTYCNNRFPLLFGLKEEHVIGRLLSALVPAAHAANIQDLFFQAMRGAACEGEFRFDVEDGIPRVVHVSLSRVDVDEAPYVCMVVTDLSQHQGEVMLRLAQKAAHSGSWQWNPITNESVWSPEYWEVFGLEPGSCRPNFENFMRSVHCDDRDEVQRSMKRQIAEGHLDLQFRAEWPDGSVHWIWLFGTLISSECVIGLSMDISERKQTEQALIRSEKLASVGRMAASIAHEINNPLSAVMNTLFLVQATDSLPASAREYLILADAELKRIAHIAQQSLGFYRESSEPTTFAVVGLLDSVIDLLDPRIKTKRINLFKDCHSGLQMTGVFGELRQVLSNLVINAVDAVAEHGTITLKATLVNDAVQVSVSDNGSGIGPSALGHIFEPFFTTKKAIGTGLGLWVSKQIVEKHRGSIKVDSDIREATRGTTFLIEIPGIDRQAK